MLLPTTPPFVGRAAQLGQLAALLDAAGRGQPQLAVIEGPAGIGKTRLAEELGDRARAAGGAFALGRCWPDGEAPPLWPWRSVLRGLGASEALLEEDPARPQGRFARFLAVREHLCRCAAGGPLVIALDDAHLADPASLLLARFLVRERGLRLVVLLTRRGGARGAHGEVDELLSDLGPEALAMPLGGLGAGGVAAFLEALGVPAGSEELVDALTSVTRGNPLHLRSIVLHSAGGAGGLGGGLEHAIRRGLDGLPGDERRLIALAALFGPDVSAHELAGLAEATPAVAAEALARAAHLGLAVESGPDRVRFVHDLVRRAAAASLGAAERFDAHARAATLLAGGEPARAARRAHHALCAAGRSAADAERSVAVAREAARALRAVDGFEAAAVLLSRAVETRAGAGLATPAAALMVEHAEAVLACGSLQQSRALFQQAARAAEEEGDAAALARAALGLGGIWVREHRLSDEAERMLALQRRALAALPEHEAVLRARLRMRLAAEGAYRGGGEAAVLEALEGARRTGDAPALAEALSLAHHALMTTPHTWARPPMARELMAVSASARDGLLSLLGLCWHTADLVLLGDARGPAAVSELLLRADALRCRTVLFIARAQETMLAIRTGAFDKAEAQAAACAALGREAGDADALAYHGAHVSAIRYFQGREGEIADLASSLAASPTLIAERERKTFECAAALFALRRGEDEPARAVLQKLGREGLASLEPSSSWLAGLLAVAELALALGDTRIAQQAYDALLPYADLPVMASVGVACFGSAHRPLGLAALACGKPDLAIEHLAAAVAANEELGHRPAAIQARAELGLARLRRARDHADERGRELLREAIAAAEAAGMGGLVRRWREAARALAGDDRVEDKVAVIAPGGDKVWRVELDGRTAVVPDRIGMRYLAQLVSAPERPIPAIALVANGALDAAPPTHRPDPVLDRPALSALQARIRALREAPALSEAEQDELSSLTRELARAIGLRGRVRSFADAPERARTAVRKAIKRAIDEISAANPAVGQHLDRRIETGSVCRYRHRPGA